MVSFVKLLASLQRLNKKMGGHGLDVRINVDFEIDVRQNLLLHIDARRVFGQH